MHASEDYEEGSRTGVQFSEGPETERSKTCTRSVLHSLKRRPIIDPMPYKDIAKQRAFQRHAVARKRAEWLNEHGPCRSCGSVENLEVDHIDRSTKIDHKVWSWAEPRRLEELSKCQVLCKKCHLEKTSQETLTPHGTNTRYTRRGCRCQLCRDAHAKTRRLRYAAGLSV